MIRAWLSNHLRKIKILSAVGAAVALVAAGWYVRDYQARGEALAASQTQAEVLSKQAQEYEQLRQLEQARVEERDGKIAALRKSAAKTQDEAREEYAKPDYRCPLPADGLSIIRRAEADVLG